MKFKENSHVGAEIVIQKLRLEKGWSQSQLAELSGLNVRTIQRIESGQPASMESLKSLASVFEVDFQQLKVGSGYKDELISKSEFMAKIQTDRVRKFYAHLIRYLVVTSILALLNYFKTPNRLWVHWVVIFWGLGVLWNAYQVFIKKQNN